MATGKTEAIYAQLKGEIQALELAPGSRLSEVLVAKRLGASRTPVREAIRRLAREGLVSFIPGEVAEVAPISLRGVRALFEFRMILEPAAIRMVALDGLTRPELLVPFREIAQELATVAEDFAIADREELVARFYDLTERFDRAIIATCHNEPLATTIADRRGQTARLRGIAHADPARMERSLAEHQRMCEAVLGGDPESAARELSQHLAVTLRTIIEGLASEIGRAGDLDFAILPSA